ncbi:sensor histidine kinase [Sphingomonas qilianensis]|uniref:histidine kinase n=1 Tax=Sphingomonas qilianensis TaxID=1736690 RepID=A0ABU9XTQ6_9SPHN
MPTSTIFEPMPNLMSVDILELVADAVICADASGRIVLFNRAAEQSFGYSADDVIGKYLEILLPERHRAEHARQVQGFALDDRERARFMGRRREVVGRRKTGEEFPAEAMVSRHVIGGRTVLTVVHRDITERKAIEDQREAISRELDHRTRNVLSVVRALVSLSARNADNVATFKESLLGRLSALAATQAVLGFGAQQSTTLSALLRAELDQYRSSDGANIVVAGPDVSVAAGAAQTLALIFHELATNSAKYGALGVDDGCITITSALIADADQYSIEWRETGGPVVVPPTRQGFGTTFIKQMGQMTFRHDVIMEYPAEGIVCRITLPSARLVA